MNDFEVRPASEKTAAFFIGFFTFMGTALGVFFLLFLLTIFTLEGGKTAPWLQPWLPPLAKVGAPVAGVIAGVYAAWRYLRTQQLKRQRTS